ncbi:hypothetical protein KOW79_006856 [Hemibagrus wyckioides]|uniref:Uncharacterized protein n=1 Tax=Hemibagrus wyckioides TaxID=337641 RepID=A0A9D3SSV9_9TELE|nr:hypothetical protein KOW79_006856 [Hemibagrus wyckioides]
MPHIMLTKMGQQDAHHFSLLKLWGEVIPVALVTVIPEELGPEGGQLVCADPDQMWVKNLKNRIDERLSYSQAHIGKHDKQVSPASNNIQRPDKSVLTPSDNKERK